MLQALVTALDVPWEAASHLLRHTRGDLTAAFKNELSAHHLNEKLVDELVWEYAAHRFGFIATCSPVQQSVIRQSLLAILKLEH